MRKAIDPGAWGELLVQSDLMLKGVDSARLASDTGVDVLGMIPARKGGRVLRVQVKTKEAQQVGAPFACSFRKGDEQKADLFAFVLNEKDRKQRWYVSAEHLKGLIKSQPKFCFYPDERQNGKGAVDFSSYKGLAGLQKFLDGFAAGHKKAKVAGA